MTQSFINTILLTLSGLTTMFLSLTAIRKTLVIQEKVDDLHVIVNSRLTELLEMTRRAANSEGFVAGVKESEKHQATQSAQE